jgi:hypothetical protein
MIYQAFPSHCYPSLHLLSLKSQIHPGTNNPVHILHPAENLLAKMHFPLASLISLFLLQEAPALPAPGAKSESPVKRFSGSYGSLGGNTSVWARNGGRDSLRLHELSPRPHGPWVQPYPPSNPEHPPDK